jgi:hypothetical protein
VIAPLLAHYAQPRHRKLRWRAWREGERSVSRFAKRLLGMRNSEEQLVVGWGAWGMAAGAGRATSRGNPPCIQAGLARRVAKTDGIVVVRVPEHFTSRTCFRCGGECGRHAAVEANRAADHPRWGRKEIRGLRLCSNSQCRRCLNRDANAAANIGVNLMLLLKDRPPLRSMTEEDVQLAEMRAQAEPQEE